MRYANLMTAAALAVAWIAGPVTALALPATSSDSESAAWTPRELTFTYRSFTTKYSCDSLREKMREVLLKLGARPDLQLVPFGCTRLTGPDQFPGVSVKMHVLQPAGAQTTQTVPATWRPVDFVMKRDPREVAGECELMSQIAREVLPLFATRNVHANNTCVPRALTIGTTELKADVLVAESNGAASGVR